jgi:hypothetical protein
MKTIQEGIERNLTEIPSNTRTIMEEVEEKRKIRRTQEAKYTTNSSE